MRHLRADYNARVQDNAGIIPEDEPVFLIRAQDISSGDAVRAWAHIHERNGGDPALAEQVRAFAKEMDSWPIKRVADAPVAVLPRESRGI